MVEMNQRSGKSEDGVIVDLENGREEEEPSRRRVQRLTNHMVEMMDRMRRRVERDKRFKCALPLCCACHSHAS